MKIEKKTNKPLLIALLFSLFIIFSASFCQDVCPPSFNPPKGLSVEKVPQFVAFGFDDNNYGNGMNWIVNFVKGKTNPKGNGNSATFDNSPIRLTFLMKGMIESSEPEEDVLNSWKNAYTNGHEIGNHTYQHVAVDIVNQLRLCDSVLQSIGIPLSEIVGFRTPQLAIVTSVFDAIFKRGFLYDCTVEHHTDIDNKLFVWPYTMDNGMDKTAFGGLQTKYPKMWELPVHEFVDASGNKVIPGFDYNAFINSGMSGQAFCDLLKNSLDYHMKTNRTPLFIGAHTDLYSETNVGATAKSRQKGIEDFITYALTLKDVRIVALKDVVTWMKNPVPLDQISKIQPLEDNNNSVKIFYRNKFLNFSQPINGNFSLSIFDMQGKLMFRKNILSNQSSIYIPLNNGIFLLRISNEQEITLSQSKVIIE